MVSNRTRIVSLLSLAGLILAVGFILYQAGFRIAPESSSTSRQQPHEPGKHLRRQAGGEQNGGSGERNGQSQSAGGNRGGEHSGGQGPHGGKREATIQSGVPGAEEITVIANGQTTHFNGSDLEKLEKITVASNRGARAGWRVETVMNHLAIPRAKTLTVVTKDGKSIDLQWEKIVATDPVLILAYNRFGGLMLMSGKELSSDVLQHGLDHYTVRTAAAEQKPTERIFLANIVKIEVKS